MRRALTLALVMTGCSGAQRAQAAKIATEIADVACEIAPLSGALAGSLLPSADREYVDLGEKGVAVACGAYRLARGASSGAP